MKNYILALFLGMGSASHVFGQDSAKVVFTTDIDHFWEAYDSARTTTDSVRQLHFIKTLYIDRGTPGLKAFMQARDYTAEGWVSSIRSYPRFWASIRPHTLTVASKVPQIEASIRRFRELYPALNDSKMYFTIGCLRSGGTTMGNMVLIGAEIATGDSTVDASEFPDNWLRDVFLHMNPGYVVPLNVHEYVHTQQQGENHITNLFDLSIMEGGADFVAELVTGIPLESAYVQYGKAHEAGLKEQFRKEMFETYWNDWFYNGGRTKTVADLGYFMGYAICSAYYKNAADKKQALADIIRFDGKDSLAADRFINHSGYFEQTIDRQAIKQDFERQRPWVVRFGPFASGDTTVDPSVGVLTVTFSEPMVPDHYSVMNGPQGKAPPMSDFSYSEDKTVLTIKLHIEPGKKYDFVLSGKGFKSAKGYPLKDYPVTFWTKAL